MTLASFSALREGAASQLATILGLRTYAIVPDQINTPAAVVSAAPITFLTYSTAFAGQADDVTLYVSLFVSRQWDRTSQASLDEYLASTGTRSIRAAIAAEPTLGGTCDDASVFEARNYGQIVYNNVEYFGCEFVIQVLA